MTAKPQAIIIGAGFTGCATAHDLALRGFGVTVIERGEIASGTSGRSHGLLHSGARYCVHDRDAALECVEESKILRRIAAPYIDPHEGLFVALDGDDLAYANTFIDGAATCRIRVEALMPQDALRLEPQLNPQIKLALSVSDSAFDPQRLVLAFAATARANGAVFRVFTEVEGLICDGRGNVVGVAFWDRSRDLRGELRGDVVINAAGAWAGEIARMGGACLSITPTVGPMVAFDHRLTQRSIHRLNQPEEGDVVLPQRRTIVVGTTSFTVDDHECAPLEEQIEAMIERGAALVPAIRQIRTWSAYTATRPLIGKGNAGRSQARTFKCFDHAQTDGVDGLVTITGGKATTCRAMAEKTADIACAKLGVRVPCRTRELPLLSYWRYYT